MCLPLGNQSSLEFRTRLDGVANWIVGIQANTAPSDYCVGESRARIANPNKFPRSTAECLGLGREQRRIVIEQKQQTCLVL